MASVKQTPKDPAPKTLTITNEEYEVFASSLVAKYCLINSEFLNVTAVEKAVVNRMKDLVGKYNTGVFAYSEDVYDHGSEELWIILAGIKSLDSSNLIHYVNENPKSHGIFEDNSPNKFLPEASDDVNMFYSNSRGLFLKIDDYNDIIACEIQYFLSTRGVWANEEDGYTYN